MNDPFQTFGIGRSPVNDVYEQIKNDLIEASKILPEVPDNKRLGTAVSGSAKTLLGKVYLTLKDYDNAVKILKEVIDSQQYTFIQTIQSFSMQIIKIILKVFLKYNILRL